MRVVRVELCPGPLGTTRVSIMNRPDAKGGRDCAARVVAQFSIFHRVGEMIKIWAGW